jgi:NhaP-type Na+/H+ and K+/H+ antiporter
LTELGRVYGLPVAAKDQGLTVGEVLTRAFSDTISVGDRLAYGPIELIVRTFGDDGRIDKVGVALEPVRFFKPQVRLPWAFWRYLGAPQAARGDATSLARPTQARPQPRHDR